MKPFPLSKGEDISVDSQSAVSPFVLGTPVGLKDWDGIYLEENFVSKINFYDVGVCIFNDDGRFARTEITFEVFSLTANAVSLRQ